MNGVLDQQAPTMMQLHKSAFVICYATAEAEVAKHSINIPANHTVFITQWTPRFGLLDNFYNSRLPVTKGPSNHTGFQGRSHSCKKRLLVSTLML
jgi:hypothetical protein